MDVEMDTQIDIGVIEAVGTGAPEAAANGGGVLVSDVGGGGVLVSDVGGGGSVVLSVVEAARSEVDELAEEVIGSVVGGSIVEATGGMVAAPTAPQAGGAGGASGSVGFCMHDSDTILNDHVLGMIIQAQEWTVNKVLSEMLVQSHWVRLAYDLNMAIYNSFAEVSVPITLVKPITREHTVKLNMACHKINMLNQFAFQAHILVHDIEHLWFIGMLSLQEVQMLCNRELPLDFLVAVWVKIRMEKVMKERVYISQSIATSEEMLQVWDEKFLFSTHTSITLEEYLKYCPGTPVYTAGVLQKLLTRGKKFGMYEPEFYCPCTHERELCPWYLELVE
ncbi:hypothetical protein SELMODRAFT_421974 [Selaginella moellendorffii]|uniref:Uncharacterized protein n=1 Tax=Selaginella moellendorffii TaxID=88036 RepID=D8SGY6_SELML|nr:hypothetical protein SELMODRAFT_421974 [Selaginella moellendorffii]